MPYFLFEETVTNFMINFDEMHRPTDRTSEKILTKHVKYILNRKVHNRYLQRRIFNLKKIINRNHIKIVAFFIKKTPEYVSL